MVCVCMEPCCGCWAPGQLLAPSAPNMVVPRVVSLALLCCADRVSLHRMGGIPAVNGRGERLLLHIGIIDILQSYRCAGHAHQVT